MTQNYYFIDYCSAPSHGRGGMGGRMSVWQVAGTADNDPAVTLWVTAVTLTHIPIP